MANRMVQSSQPIILVIHLLTMIRRVTMPMVNVIKIVVYILIEELRFTSPSAGGPPASIGTWWERTLTVDYPKVLDRRG